MTQTEDLPPFVHDSIFHFFSLSSTRNLFPPNIVQATMFQYRTHLEPPLNATAELANGTKLYISDLSSEVRNRFTVSKYKLTNFEGKEG